MRDRVRAIQNREMWPLNASEKRRYLAATVRGGVQVARGKSHAKADSAGDKVLKEAIERVQAEDRATEALRKKKIQEKADKKVQKRAESIWW